MNISTITWTLTNLLPIDYWYDKRIITCYIPPSPGSSKYGCASRSYMTVGTGVSRTTSRLSPSGSSRP